MLGKPPTGPIKQVCLCLIITICKHAWSLWCLFQRAYQSPKSLIPAAPVTWGQNVSITCSISTQLSGVTFILQKTSSTFRTTQTSSTNSAIFNIPKVDFDKAGWYRCQYQTNISSQSFNSSMSDSVRLSVTGKTNISWSYVSFTCD